MNAEPQCDNGVVVRARKMAEGSRVFGNYDKF